MKRLLGFPAKQETQAVTSAPLETAPYKVPEPAATTPIPFVVEATAPVKAVPKPKAIAKPRAPAKPKAAAAPKPKAPAKAPAKPKIKVAK